MPSDALGTSIHVEESSVQRDSSSPLTENPTKAMKMKIFPTETESVNGFVPARGCV
jgi:hypothetical protein